MPNDMGSKPNKLFVNALEEKSYLSCPPGVDNDFKELWYRIVNDFPHDYFRASDTDMLVQYVEAEIQRREVAAQLKEEGYVVDGVKESKANPLVAVQAQLATQVRACARMLRLAPSARTQSSQVPKTPSKAPEAPATAAKRKLRLAGVVDPDA